MENFSCAIDEGKRFKTGPCLYERHKTIEGNRTCSECGYYKSYLSPSKIKISGSRGKSPQKTNEKKKVTRHGSLVFSEFHNEEMAGERNDKKIHALLQSTSALRDELGIPVKLKIDNRGKLYVLELQQKNSLDGKPEVEYLYGFTEETRGEFKKIFKKCDEGYDEEKVESFINRIESDIGNLVKVKRDLGDRKHFHVQNEEDIIEALERANEYLLKICSGRFKVLSQPKHSYVYKFETPDDPLAVDLCEEVKDRCNFKSETVLRLQQDLVQDLKSAVSIERRKRGRLNADTDDLAFQIARWFREFMGSPRPYTGPYPEIVRKCFEICGFNYENNRSRAIGHALRRLAQS
jgi:hypothetical protein